jgi:ABC-type glycerol-3-phosphate transport system permease component
MPDARAYVRDPWPRRRRRIATALTYAILALVAVWVLLPLWSLLWTAFDPTLKGYPSEFQLWPKEWSLSVISSTFAKPAQSLTFLGLLKNSLFVAGTAAAIAVVFGASMAYAFARMRFPGRTAGGFVILLGAFLPAVALMVPLYVLLESVGLRRTQFGLALVYAAMAMPLALWLMRAAFAAIPKELEEAAFLDGAGRFQTFRRVTLPLAAPSIVVAALLAFLIGYAEFALGWLFVEKGTDVTLAMAMSGAEIGIFGPAWARLAALVLMAIVPVVIVFVVLQRWFLRSPLYGGTDT